MSFSSESDPKKNNGGGHKFPGLLSQKQADNIWESNGTKKKRVTSPVILHKTIRDWFTSAPPGSEDRTVRLRNFVAMLVAEAMQLEWNGEKRGTDKTIRALAIRILCDKLDTAKPAIQVNVDPDAAPWWAGQTVSPFFKRLMDETRGRKLSADQMLELLAKTDEHGEHPPRIIDCDSLSEPTE